MLVEVEGGKLKSVSGDKDNPDSQGFLLRVRSSASTCRSFGTLFFGCVECAQKT
jgi:hypothetical protein